MDIQRDNKRPHSVKETTDRNTTRHEMYAQKTAAEKETFLSQRRLKNRESKSRLFQNRTSEKLMHSAISSYVSPFANSMTQTTIIEASCSLSQTINERGPFPSLTISKNGTNVVQPISVFERGETSGTPNEKCTPVYESPLIEGKGTNVVQPISIFEKGETSGTSNEKCTPAYESAPTQENAGEVGEDFIN